VSADGRPIPNLYWGLKQDAHYDVALALQRRQPLCAPAKLSLTDRLLKLVQPTAVAQGSCNIVDCTGSYYQQLAPVSCGTGCASNYQKQSNSALKYANRGYVDTGADCGSCGSLCEQITCDNGSPALCDTAADCTGVSGKPYCVSNTCSATCSQNSDCTGGCQVCNTSGACVSSCLSCQTCSSGSCEDNCSGCTACSSETNSCQQVNSNCPDFSNCSGSGTVCESSGCCDNGSEDDDCDSEGNDDYESADGCDCVNNEDCESDWCNGGRCGSDDPIVVDLSGAGFVLTNAESGVKFDFFGTGKPMQMPWTAAGSSSGWLALDRKGDGRVDNGADLFSNVAPQPDSRARAKLGFRALAAYDLPAKGGNGDGTIDQRDAIFAKLLVWVDKNHNGISEPGELLTMQQAGVQSISLQFELSSWTDAFGNQFRYRSKITFVGGARPGDRYIYDVMLGMGSAPTQQK
jgi:hypothetical protein